MMRALFLKKGVWFFLAAVALYVAGNFALNNIYKNLLAQAHSLHQAQQSFDPGGRSSVTIRRLDSEIDYSDIKLIFDTNASQVTVNNENLRLNVTGKMDDGNLNIALTSVKAREYSRSRGLIIRLPSSVKNLKFSNVHSVEISGRLPLADADLSLEISDCEPYLSMESFTVSHLKLTSACQMLSKERRQGAGLTLGTGVEIKRLDVTMQQGSLNFSATTIPQQIQLNIGDDVIVTGQRAFLKSAQFTNNF